VLVVAVMHGSLKAFSDRLSDSAHLPGDPFIVSIGGLVGFGVIAVAVFIAYSRRRRIPMDTPKPVTERRPEERATGSRMSTSVVHRGGVQPLPAP
jgi:hypothetical protein